MEEEDIFLSTQTNAEEIMKTTFILIFLLCLNAYHLTNTINDIALKLNFLNTTVNVFNGLQTVSSQWK